MHTHEDEFDETPFSFEGLGRFLGMGRCRRKRTRHPLFLLFIHLRYDGLTLRLDVATVDNLHATYQGEALPAVVLLWVNRFLRMTMTMSCGVGPQTKKRSLPSGLPSGPGAADWDYEVEAGSFLS